MAPTPASFEERSDGQMSGLAEDPARVRLGTLVTLRWIAVAGQLLTLLIVRYGLGFDFPVVWAISAVAVSALFNLFLALGLPAGHRLTDRQAALQLGFDLAQLAFLLYLTGGLSNPFALLILVPVTISASVLSRGSTIALLVTGLAFASLLALYHLPLPWRGERVPLPGLYLFGIWAGLALAMTFLTLYVARVSEDARQRALALAATQAALARAQKLSDLGTLAAAAAHQLGTPLGTITLAARELLRDTPEGDPRREDVELIDSQIKRCRSILEQLSQTPVGEEEHPFSRQPLAALAREAARPFEHLTEVAIHIRTNPPDDEDAPQPVVRRRPEILHALTNLIENAVGFAHLRVDIDISWTREAAEVRIEDDGPGFDPAILKNLGEPYVTTRGSRPVARRGEGDRAGLGLGVFIAKTLLESTGAELAFRNRREGGAAVEIRWPRSLLAGMEFPNQG